MIYTSYFAKIKKLQSDRVIPISIAAYPPKGYRGLEYKKLSPTKDILTEWKRTRNTKRYTERFTSEVLSKLNPSEVEKELYAMLPPGKDKIVLVCYEKSGEFCHRHLVADWFKSNGIRCIELLL